jgi:integrase
MLSEDEAMTRIDGRYNDDGGLWIIVRSNGKAASYFFEYNGKLVGEKGWESVSLGARKKISLALARKRAELCRSLIERGISPRHWRSHERKELQAQIAKDLTVAKAIDEFLKFGDEKLWRKIEVRNQKRGIVRRYFENRPIWKMLVQEVEPEHAAAVLDPIWFPKPRAGSTVQSFGHSMFKWLKLHKLYVGENPFDGSIYSPMVQILGGPQPPRHISNRQEPEVEDLTLLMAHLCTPPKHSDDVCTTKEAAEATGHDPDAILRAIHKKIFPGAYKWADWEGATYLIPVEELAAGPFRLLHPPRQSDEIPVEYLALRYVLLTLVRSMMGARLLWNQINDRRDLIIYPKTHHKAGMTTHDEYNVIITPAVAQLFDEAHAYQERHNIKSEYVFVRKPTPYGIDFLDEKPLGRANCWYNFKLLMSRIPGIENPHVTLHDIRTSFITWAVDTHDYPAQHADAVLGHAIKGIPNKTYFRNVKYLAQMREMKTHWENVLLQRLTKPVDVLLPRSQATIRRFGPSTKERWNA